MRTSILAFCAVVAVAGSAFYRTAVADEYLQLITTIPIERDSTEITSITPIGDFNADGYGDLAIGLGSVGYSPYFEAVYLYFGGQGFDSIPDLRFFGDPNNQTYCPTPLYGTSFGRCVAALGDFNGDGHDDFAISASSLCNPVWSQGRIYIYFGGPNPDTIPDLTIDGMHDYDFMGSMMASGDFNGDGFGDLISHAGDVFYGERMCIFLGGNPPDSTVDWVYTFPRGDPEILEVSAAFDPNNDSHDDYCWTRSARDSSFFFFLGGDTLSHQPFLRGDPYHFLDFDLSGDGVDDFWGRVGSVSYLFLGGNPLDFEPDYPLGRLGAWPSIYHRAGHADMFMVDDGSRFIMYNIGIPPDTIPAAYIYYDFARFPSAPDIGDINGDGGGELALGTRRDSSIQNVGIYTIVTTNIDDNGNNSRPPGNITLTAYPNPFNGVVEITCQGLNQEGGEVEIQIFDLLGRVVAQLDISGSSRQVTWDGTDKAGHPVASGLYFYGLKNRPQSFRKMTLLR
jgi:hypothetical protein